MSETSAKPRVRVGVVGIGRMGGYHLQKFLQLPQAEVVGILDHNPVHGAAVAEKFGVRSFDTLPELLTEVDALVIAAPTATHFSIARQALEAEVHVLVEKPITATVAEAEELVKLAARKNLALQVGMVERFRLQTLSRGASLRPVRFIEGDRLTLAPGRESGINVVNDLMIHDLDLVLSLVGEDPIVISAVGIPVLTPQADIANVRLEFPSGAIANLNASRISREALRKFRVFSADAYVSMDFIANTVDICRRDENNRIVTETLPAASIDSLLEQAREFLDCIQTGRTPTVRGEDGLRALRIAEEVSRQIVERTAHAPGRLWADTPPPTVARD